MLQLEVERNAYYPGEIVRGRVHFTPRKDLSCVGVYVRFKGYEHSAWENEDAAVTIDPNTAAVTTQALVHSGKRKHIFKFVKTLWGNTWGQSNKKIKLKAQSYSWPFAFELPRHIPPSLEYKKGRVRIEYVLKAHVKVPYNKSVKVTKMLSVGSVVQPRGTEIKDFEVSKSSKWDRAMNLNKDSRFSLRATTKRQYTWPEDKFRFRLKIDNRTHASFNSLVVRIQQYWKSGSLTDKVRFAKYKVTEGFPVEKATSMDRFIEIPMPGRLTLVPTTNASLVQLSYHLVLEFHIGGLIKNPTIHIPIIISSVPVIGSTTVNATQGPVEDDSQLPVSHAMPIDIDITTHQDVNVDGEMYQTQEVTQGVPHTIGVPQANVPIATPAPTAPVVTAYPTAVTAQPTVVTVPPPQPTRVTPIVNTYTTQTSASYQQQPKTYVPSSLSHSFSATSSTASYPSVPGHYPTANTTNFDSSSTSSFYPQSSSYNTSAQHMTGHHGHNHHRHSSVPAITSHHDQSYQGGHVPSNSTSSLYPNNTSNYGNSSYNQANYNNTSSAYPTTAQSNYPTSNTQNYGNNYNSSSYNANTASGYNTTSNFPPNTSYYNGGQQADSPPPPLPKKSPPTSHHNTYNNQYQYQQQYPTSNTAASSTGYTNGQYNSSNYQPSNTQSTYNAPVNSSTYTSQNSAQQNTSGQYNTGNYQPNNTSSYNSYQPNTYTPSTYNTSAATSNYTPANPQLSRSADATQNTYSPPNVPLSQSHDSSASQVKLQRRLSKPLPPIPQLQPNYLDPVPEHVLHSNNSAYAEVPDDLPDDPDAVYDDTGVVSDGQMSSLNESFENIDIQDNEVLVVVVQDQNDGDFEEVFLSSPTAYSLFKDIAATFHRSPSEIDKVIKLSNQSLVKRDEQVERLTVNERLRVYFK
eukprot:TRINITY_DN1615_c0_g1_i1.p1 TRINITY_DN1615_c0_g1~~TRINITY_DN1615_c0_g1_i1.p1  ORF type:complete len:910 (+),score=183.50 TRINITY_DN1615_c0_g1_i1:81-2810(+)